MEHLGTISEGEWNSYNGMCNEEADFMVHLLGNCSLPNDVPSSSHHQASSYWPNQESNMNLVGFYDSSIYSSDEIDLSAYSFPQGSSYGGGSGICFPESYHPNTPQQFFVANNNLTTMDYSNNVMEGGHFLKHDVSNDSIDSNENSTELPMPERMEEEKVTSYSAKKRLRIPRDVERSKRSMKLKENVKVDDDNDENNSDYKKVVRYRENSSSCSEDDNELNKLVSGSSGALNSNGKTRANRGSATDPQSLYARKRRERINERLRILQSIVPNGTKVDISTMLEEAVEYVKFLQLQIKLLSSDEHWMYAPIAYNGMDIGLDLRSPIPKSQT